MALQMFNIRPTSSFMDANPWMQAASTMEQMRAQQLANQRAQYMTDELPTQLRQQELARKLANQLATTRAQFAPQQMQAALDQTREKTSLMPQQMGVMQQNAATRELVANLAKQRLPTQQVYALRALMGDPKFEAMLTKDPQLAMQLGHNITGSIEAMGDMQNMASGAPMGMPGEGPSEHDQMMGKAIQDAAQSSLLKKTQPTKQLEQRIYDVSAQNMIKKLEPIWPVLSEYAGVRGQAKLMRDRFRASVLGENIPSYNTYLNFVRVQGPSLANELRRAYGGSATEGERTLMNNLVMPGYLEGNYGIGLDQLKTLTQTLGANTQAISKSTAEIQNQLRKSTDETPGNVPEHAPSGRVRVRAPDGTTGTVPGSQLGEFIKRGYRRI